MLESEKYKIKRKDLIEKIKFKQNLLEQGY